MTADESDALRAEHGIDDPDTWGESEPIPTSHRLDVTISVRFTAAEIAAVRQRAAAAGMKPTTYIRRAVLDQDDVPVDRAALRKALSVIASEVAAIEDAVTPRRPARPTSRKPLSA